MKKKLTILFVVYVLASATYGYDIVGPIEYANPDGEHLKMTLYVPENTPELRPVVMLIHGGAWRFGSRHSCVWYRRRFAENGYVVASVDYRLMPEYPFPACLYDVKAAVRWLRLHSEEYAIDPERIAVMGESAGGHLAAMLATTTPENGLEGPNNPGASSAVQAALIMYGAFDLSYFRNLPGDLDITKFAENYFERFVGASDTSQEEKYLNASPITYVSAETCPMLLVHGEDDRLIPYKQSEDFAERLRMVGIPVEFITLPDRGHAFDRFYLEDREDVFKRMSSFLETWLNSRPVIVGP